MKATETPLMKQYHEMKKKHPDCILLFRVGDFYETFGEDAITTSEILGITLTKRANGSAKSVELSGFPHRRLDTYLPKLVRAGKRVAICEQIEDPKQSDKPVEREITKLVTPSSYTKLPNGLTIGPKEQVGMCGFNDAHGRFKTYDGRIGVFLEEKNKWFFAPLVIPKEDEERYQLYIAISWMYSEWIWIDEYQEEKLPGYYDKLKALYDEFVSKYGYLNDPKNAKFIKLDAYADNLEILERKVIDKNGVEAYVPGEGFEKIRQRVNQITRRFDISALISAISAFFDSLNILSIFGEISRKTQEIRKLSKELGVSPKLIFEECNSMYQPYTPSLFD